MGGAIKYGLRFRAVEMEEFKTHPHLYLLQLVVSVESGIDVDGDKPVESVLRYNWVSSA